MSAPLIIGIHGLNNKPRRAVLRAWWVAALKEGLARNLDNPPALPDFELSYWADLNHPVPYADDADPEPYLPADGNRPMRPVRRGRRRLIAALGLEAAGKLLETVARADFLEERLEQLIAAKANDLYRYHADKALRARIRARLHGKLRKARDAGRPTLLIAHSMGSIIAYDVLREHRDLTVDHLLTIGSPLGLAEVKDAAAREFGEPRIPHGVARWTNIADPRDKVAALDVRLASDYGPGAHCPRIDDQQTRNGYVGPNGKPNPHKVYGYLRTPEMSRIIAGWLSPHSG